MRNLKRILALAMALVMTVSMMVVGASAASYTDAESINADYSVAVDVMYGVGVFEGDTEGNFLPEMELTRAMAAVMMARLKLGKTVADKLPDNKASVFTDVPAGEWYTGEVQYCQSVGLIAGCGDGTFDPDGKLTGVAFAKLILGAMGYDADVQGYVGTNWATNIFVDAIDNNLIVEDVALDEVVTRQVAAQMMYQALEQDTVYYTKAFDKATMAEIKKGPFGDSDTFGEEYFGLIKVEGIVDAVDYYYGSTTIDGLEVRGAGADFNNIGYAGFVWALLGGAENSYYLTAVSDVIITGTSMGYSTNNATIDNLTNYKNINYIGYIDEAGCSVYLNGVYQGEIALDEEYAIVYEAETKEAVEGALDKAGTVGVKVDFVDNDNQGKAEAIVITEYTFAEVSKVVKQSKSGVVSVKYYELTNLTADEETVEVVYPSELEYVDSLSKGDYVTYVAYDLDYYYKDLNEYDTYLVNVLSVAEGEFESITRTQLWGSDNYYVRVYNIDGEGYVKSGLSKAANTGYLVNTNINEDVVYVLDQYGYVVYAAAPDADPDTYLYVFDNEHTKALTGVAEAMVAYTDGAVELINVGGNYYRSALADKVYTYTVKNGAHKVVLADYEKWTGIDYYTYEVTMNGEDATDLTIVDLRDVFAGEAEDGTVYVGHTEIPSFEDGTLLYVADIDLAFLTDGNDPASAANLSASFVVFNTKTNIVDKIKVGNNSYEYTYELEAGVLIDGELVTNFVLSDYQKDMVDTFGVGVYTFAKNGDLYEYVSFAEDSVKWTPAANGTIIIDNVDVTAANIFSDIIVLDISEGEINEWEQLVKPGYYYSYTDTDNKILYVVGDNVIGSSGLLAYAGEAGTGAVCGGNEYWAYSKKVTNYAPVQVAAYTVNDVLKFVAGTTAAVEGEGEYVAVVNAATGVVIEYAPVVKGVASFTMPACNVVTVNGYYNYFLNGNEKFTAEVGFDGNMNWACLADLAGTVAADTFVKVEWTDDKGVAKTATFAVADLATTPIDVVNYDEYITTNWVSVTGVEEEVFYAQIGDEITIVNDYYTEYAVDLSITGADIATARLNVGDSETIVVKGNVVVSVAPVTGTAATAATDGTAVDNAIVAGDATIVLAPNTEYTLSTIQAADDIVIVGSAGTVITNALDLRGDNGDVSITFENVTLEGGIGNWSAVKDLTLKNCVVEGTFHLDVMFGNLIAEDCTFAGKVQSGATGEAASATFVDCVFTATDSTSIWGDKGIRAYAPTVFDGCEFNNRVVLAGSNGLALTFDGCTMNGGDAVTNDVIKGGNVPTVTIK